MNLICFNKLLKPNSMLIKSKRSKYTKILVKMIGNLVTYPYTTRSDVINYLAKNGYNQVICEPIKPNQFQII